MPARLERKQTPKNPPVMDVLNKDIVIRIKFYLVFALFVTLFVVVCFLSKGPTYGYL